MCNFQLSVRQLRRWDGHVSVSINPFLVSAANTVPGANAVLRSKLAFRSRTRCAKLTAQPRSKAARATLWVVALAAPDAAVAAEISLYTGTQTFQDALFQRFRGLQMHLTPPQLALWMLHLPRLPCLARILWMDQTSFEARLQVPKLRPDPLTNLEDVTKRSTATQSLKASHPIPLRI